ncbi:hypothetical protein C8A05DRAFT_29060 [Staphylotrichum tortipilum]|uniref:Uncharacterized protein n=1 Tax=Staphylotrichum tortipilum TaxID=2831512 RepID=A0AAN6MTX8_9PEZI|nr:hypothetical protein C8A05DRAFT_29060 [Staphylotrichum longicolle]
MCNRYRRTFACGHTVEELVTCADQAAQPRKPCPRGVRYHEDTQDGSCGCHS